MSEGSRKDSKPLVKKLVIAVFAMFGFGFALVPLYDVFCDITGLNGKTSNEVAQQSTGTIDTSRSIRVQFISRTAKDIPWQFYPEEAEVVVHPGEERFVKFFAKNNSNMKMVGQAVPSVSPGRAANYFHKIECFCFDQQPLNMDQEVWMPLQFYIDPDIPEDVSTLTLSYTLYDVTNKTKS